MRTTKSAKRTKVKDDKTILPKQEEMVEMHSQPRGFCVGIGASAGGLEALEQFFRNMKPDSGLSFVVVQHLSPDYKSLMVELLSKHTLMKVHRAEDGMEIMPDCIYLIPPKKNMTVFHGKLFLTEQDHQHVINLPIDIFLRSLAEDYGDKSIGIILSGTGSDGTLGIRAIKGIGGMVMAQDDSSAKFDGMPRSAISTGLVDYVLAADKMPEKLLSYVKHPLTIGAEEKQSLPAHDNAMSKILSIIRNVTGADFTYYKPNTIIRRLERRISINQIRNFEDYVTFIEQSVKEVNILYKELLIGVTKFFRDSEGFEILKEQIIPDLFKNKKKEEPLRLWCVACSTGEEAYSLAILLREHMEYTGQNQDVKIFATDMDKEAIEYASMGFYTESIIADVSFDRLQNYFIKKEKGYQVKETIRKMVIFATHNIIKDPPFSRIDLISCRNMLIYLKPVMQKKVLSLFHFALNKDGYLFLGSSESLGDLSRNFSTISSKWKIYAYKEGFGRDSIGEFLMPSITQSKSNSIVVDSSVKLNTFNSELTEGIYNTIIQEFIPPSVIINESFEIVHICKDVNKFIHLPTGRVTLDIISLLRKELSTAVSIAIHKALKENKEIIYNDLKIKDKDGIQLVKVRVKPFEGLVKSRKLVFVFFEEQAKQHTPKDSKLNQTVEYDTEQQIQDLELELKYTKENLQATIEELGTSNEELQATNEELISSNEELQSTNEELQSVNEELYTVNSEYQNKIEVLTQLNNDINNLLKNTNIGTVFLDRNLLIRKFTPAVTSAINILDMDIGRPIHHISHNTFYENFLDDIENVLKTLVPKEVEVEGKKNNWFLMRILPYRTLENAIDGVVITFFDITERKAFEEQIERKNRLLISVLDNSPIASTILNKDGRITYANHMAEEVLGITKDEITLRHYNAPHWRISYENGDKYPNEKLPFFLVMNTGKPVFDIVHVIEWPGGEKKTLSINGSPIFDVKGQVDGVVCTMLDITDRRMLEEKIIRERDLLLRILENSPGAKIMTDKEGKISLANPLVKKLLEIPENRNLKGIAYKDLGIEPIDLLEGYETIVEKVIDTCKSQFNIQHRLTTTFNANEKILFINASPAFDENQQVEGVIISIDSHFTASLNTELLEKQNKLLSQLIDDAIITIDINSTIVFWNLKAEERTGLKQSEVMGKKCYALDSDIKTKSPCFLSSKAKGSAACKKLIFNAGDKDVVISLKKVDIFENEKGQVLGAIGLFT
jgi:two-component system, chemotaxis family, CheB/CheR fusion protein